MVSSYILVIVVFLAYYFLVLLSEKKVMEDPKEILDKFLSVTLLYAGLSLIYFSLTGEALFGESLETYNVYIFIIGFISVLWTIPNLMKEFSFFRRFQRKGKKKANS
jgi:hypothetical protein